MKAIYGYGSPRFRLGDGEAVFGAHQGAGQVEFEPIGHEFETLAGDLIEVPRGWRATAKLRLLNVKNLDYAPHLKLIQLINLSRSTGLPLKCKPRFENGMQLELAVKLRGNFGYAELTNLNAGQSIELEFVAVRLLSELPGFVNLPGYLLIGTGSYLLLSADGSRLLVPETNFSEIEIDDEEYR